MTARAPWSVCAIWSVASGSWTVSAPADAGTLVRDVAAFTARFRAAMDDDFNTPQALAAIFDLASTLYAYRDQMLLGKRARRALFGSASPR